MKCLVALSLPLLLTGCAVEGARTTFPLEMAGAVPSGPNARGWTVSLDEAVLHVGPVRFWEGSVGVARRSALEWLYPTAHAHPGHWTRGAARGDWVETATVDLLGEPAPLGTVAALTGDIGSAELELPVAPDGLLQGASVRLSGLATLGEAQVRFSETLIVSEPIEAIRFEHALTGEPGAVRVEVSLARWLERIDFSTVAAPDAGGVSALPPESQAGNALRRGIADPGAYTFRWSSPQ